MLGDNIKNARKSRCMTQEELAAKLNVVRQTVSKWEKNMSVPDADLLEKLADVLDIDIYALLGCENQETEGPSEDYFKYISEQLAKNNEQEAYRMRAQKKTLTVIAIILISIFVFYFLWYLLGKTADLNDNIEVIPKGVMGFIIASHHIDILG